jgi:hypothetical protein
MQFLVRPVLHRPLARSIRVAAVTIVAAVALAPQPALASGKDVISECVDGRTISHHTAADYAKALSSMSADVDEYTDCRDRISAARDRDALAAGKKRGAGTALAVGGTGGSGGGTGGTVDSIVGTGAGVTTDPTDAAGATVDATTATSPLEQALPSYDGSADPDLAMLPVSSPSANESTGTGIGDHRWPAVPIILALSVIALTAARGLQAWGQRSDRLQPGIDGA